MTDCGSLAAFLGLSVIDNGSMTLVRVIDDGFIFSFFFFAIKNFFLECGSPYLLLTFFGGGGNE